MISHTIDFFYGAVCRWYSNVSFRKRALATEFDPEMRHRTFVLQDGEEAMAERRGTPEQAEETNPGHWAVCRCSSDRPDLVNMPAIRNAVFACPQGYRAAGAWQAAEAVDGQFSYYDMSDRLQCAHLSEAPRVADHQELSDLDLEMGFGCHDFGLLLRDVIVAAGVEAERQRAWGLQLNHAPTLIVHEAGTRFVNDLVRVLTRYSEYISRDAAQPRFAL